MSPDRNVNKGIVVSGSGTLNAGAVAAGDHARAEYRGGGSSSTADELRLLRADLATLVERLRGAEAAGLADQDQLAETAGQAEAELARQRPNKHSLLGLLGGLAAGVAPVATLAEATEKIRQTVMNLF